MLKNYFVITLRSLMKKKAFVFINILGIGLAVAFCIVAYLNWDFRATWDSDQVKASSIYRIQFWRDVNEGRDRFGSSPLPMANHIKQNVKEVKAITRFTVGNNTLRIGNEVFNPHTYYADPNFFELFTIQLKYGNIDDFKDKSRIFISDELARNYFNREDVVGEQVTQINNGSSKEFIIGGVFKSWLSNSSFDYDAITQLDNLRDTGTPLGDMVDNWRDWGTTFIQLEDPNDFASVNKQLQQYIEPQNLARPGFKVSEFYLVPFVGMADLNSQKPFIQMNDLRRAVPYAVVTLPSILAVLLLLIACFNFTNTSIALSSQRLKEIGIRKVMGGFRKQLIIQFLSENIFLCTLGFLVGLVIAEFLVPAYDELWPWLQLSLSYQDNLGMLLFLFGLLVFTGLVAGAYPAFYITSFQPINILKGRAKLAGNSWLTRSLLGFQFTIALITIIFAVGFYNNANYQKHYDMGFTDHDVISVYVDNEGTFNTYRDAIAGNEDITSIAGTRDHIGNSMYSGVVNYESQQKQINILDVGEDYIKTMNIEILEGRDFEKASVNDLTESILVSEEFVKAFGITHAIGKRILYRDSIQLFIIGVTKNIYANGLLDVMEPVMIRYISPEQYSRLVVRTSSGKAVAVNVIMKQKWQQLFPNQIYPGYFIESSFDLTRETNQSAIKVFTFLGFFSVLMSAIGLFALVSLTVMKRVKEIGIRKVLGASIMSIIRIISFEFILILSLSSVLGGVLGYTGVNVTINIAWEYFERVSIATLVASVSALILTAAITVGMKIITAARVNPIKSLRSE